MMPTLQGYERLMREKRFHAAAREACVRAAEAASDTADPATVARYLHVARRAVLTAISEADLEELRAIWRDKDLASALGDELRSRVADAIPTLPDGFTPS